MKRDIESKISLAALRLAAKKSWSSLTLEQIAAAAKVPPAQVRKTFADRNRILPAIVHLMDARTEANAGTIDRRAPPHDRLFQVMMARFDALQEHRAGILAILDECRCDPSLARFIVPEQGKSMQKLLAMARLESDGPQKQIAALGLFAVYCRVLWAWRADHSNDMAKTMAALDQGLRCVGRIAEIIFRRSKSHS